MNTSGRTYANWAWDAGTSTVTNNDGSIASQVRASAASGFSIVTYTGNNTAGASVGHGLNAAVEFLIVKSRDQSGQYWHVWHSSLANNEYIYLNVSNAKTSGNDFLNGTAPGSSVFTLGSGNACNKSGDSVVAYCFAPVAGYSAMGSYSSGSDPFVFTGFSPRFVLLKKTNAAGHWYMFDSERGPINPNETWLEANGSGAEQTHANGDIRFLSNGFQPIGSDIDAGGGSYIYYAVAKNPFASNGGLAR